MAGGPQTCVGVVLAGGASRRFGSDKALASAAPGRPTMLEVALEALAPWCAEVVVVRADPLPAALETRARRLVDDRRGPLQALCAAFESESADRWLVAACDLPNLGPEPYGRLLEALGDHDIACFSGESGLEPLVAVWSASVLPALREAAGSDPQPSLRAFLNRVETRAIEPEASERTCLWNVNRREDLVVPEEPR